MAEPCAETPAAHAVPPTATPIPEFERQRPRRPRRPRATRAAARPAAAPAAAPGGAAAPLPDSAPLLVVAPPAPVPTIATSGASPAPLPLPSLVVATGDPSLMRMLTFALDQLQLRCVTFTSGTAVLDALLAGPPGRTPPVVLLDVDLPGVDGYAILERLRAERPGQSLVVVLSSHADESVQVRSLLAGALDHLAKPFNVRVLMAKVQRWTEIARRCEAAA